MCYCFKKETLFLKYDDCFWKWAFESSSSQIWLKNLLCKYDQEFSEARG